MRYIPGEMLSGNQKCQIRKVAKFATTTNDEIDQYGWLISSNRSFPHNYKAPHALRVTLDRVKDANKKLVEEYAKKRINGKLKAEGLGAKGKTKSPRADKKPRSSPSYMAVEAQTTFVREYTLIEKIDIPAQDK